MVSKNPVAGVHNVSRSCYNQASSADRPNGTPGYAETYKGYSVLQQHVLFWDRDGDGEIWPCDTWRGFRDLGFNILFSALAVLCINLALSLPTRCV